MNIFKDFSSKTKDTIRLILFILAVWSISSSSSTAAKDNSTYFPGELIIQFFEDSQPNLLSEDFQAQKLKPKRLLSRRLHIWLYEYDAKSTSDEALLASVSNHNQVAIAQFNHEVSLRSTFPDDPNFGNQWALHNTAQLGGVVDADIDAPEAWDIATGDTTVQGDEIVIAVIDGGFDLNHNDLLFWKNELEIPGNGIDDDGNGYIDDYHGWNAYNNSGNIPGGNHGTHVTGICAAAGNNGIGVSGVNWNVKVMPIAGSSGNEATVVAAYGYVFEMRKRYNETDGAEGAFVVSTNSSFGVDFGNPDNFPIWCAMYDSMGQAGIISAAATANLNIDIDVQGDVPTACGSDYLLSVTNTTNADVKNSGAAYGATTIDLGAPGTTIFSTTSGNSYGYLTGTSMATPQVTGAVALMYSGACSGFISAYKNDPATYALDVLQAILDGTDPIPSLNGVTVSGGRLNIFNSLNEMGQLLCGTAITHTPLEDTKDSVNPYEVICEIKSDTTLSAGDQLLYYNLDTFWQIDTLTPTGQPDEFHAFIPAQSPGTIIDYYLYAIDANGSADTTDIVTFQVIDYAMTLDPLFDSASAVVDDTVWYQLTITNNGLYSDQYALTSSGNFWNTTIWDSAGFFMIDLSSVLLEDSSFTFRVSVVISNSFFGESDTALIEVVSGSNPAIFDQSSLITTSLGVPLTLPFEEEFPTTTIDPAKWVSFLNIEINSIGLNIPSPPYALNLNGGPVGADTIVSQVIDLDGQCNSVLRYDYQRTGGGNSTETGDNLYFEYLDSSANWQLLEQYLGSDTDMTEFIQVAHDLPNDACHNAFRLRIRTTGTAGPFDDWFVDNINISAPYICGDVNFDGEFVGIIELTYLVDFVFRGGPPPPFLPAADVNGDGEFVGILELTYLVDFIFRGGPAPVCPD